MKRQFFQLALDDPLNKEVVLIKPKKEHKASLMQCTKCGNANSTTLVTRSMKKVEQRSRFFQLALDDPLDKEEVLY
jgi:hypothetical protein